jgi:hypothetical protein
LLFNSNVFVFLFLPATVGGFALFGRLNREAQILWLTFASLCFYAWWDWRYVGLLFASMVFNFVMGLAAPGRRDLLIFAVAGNLFILGFFKYWGFVATDVSLLLGLNLPVPDFTLPLGISFYTFTQIAFLADSYRKEAREPRLRLGGGFLPCCVYLRGETGRAHPLSLLSILITVNPIQYLWDLAFGARCGGCYAATIGPDAMMRCDPHGVDATLYMAHAM